MNMIYVKLLVGAVLFGAWFYLSTQSVPNSKEIIAFIQLTLGALAHNLISEDTTNRNLTVQQNAPQPTQTVVLPPAVEPPKVPAQPTPQP